MIVGCYSLHLYCDCKNPNHRYDEFPHEFSAEHGTSCRRLARKRGWKLTTGNQAICPKCTAAGIEPTPGIDYGDAALRTSPPREDT